MSKQTCVYCNSHFEVLQDDKSSVVVIGQEYDSEMNMNVPVVVFVCGECSKYIPFSAAANGVFDEPV